MALAGQRVSPAPRLSCAASTATSQRRAVHRVGIQRLPAATQRACLREPERAVGGYQADVRQIAGGVAHAELVITDVKLIGRPEFFRYNVIDMMRELEIDVGVPVAAVVDGDGRVISGMVPAGKYATLTHVGSPHELVGATKTLLDWADAQGLRWDMSPGDNGERWAGWLEIYLTDPSQEPDMSKWRTQLAFRLAS